MLMYKIVQQDWLIIKKKQIQTETVELLKIIYMKH